MSNRATQRAAVTVVIPAYNAEKLIAKTLESVQRQTYLDWNVIVVDDGSTDATREVVKNFSAADARISLLALDRNHGAPAGPRNRAVAVAEGQWIAFLDADDIWHPQKLELQMLQLARYGARFCCSAMQDFSNDAEVKDPRYEDPISTRWLTFSQNRFKGRIPSSSVVVATELIRTFQFEEDPTYKAVEDYHCWLRILRSGVKCLRIDLPLLHYRISPAQISRSKFTMAKRIYNLHRKFERTTSAAAALFTLTHVAGGVYLRYLRGKL